MVRAIDQGDDDVDDRVAADDTTLQCLPDALLDSRDELARDRSTDDPVLEPDAVATLGALMPGGSLASFSDRGALVAAPGVGILSTTAPPRRTDPDAGFAGALRSSKASSSDSSGARCS